MTAAILAGGESRRMGTDKASLEVDGVPLLERIARIAVSLELPTQVVGREDSWPGQGPLGGLHTALTHADGPVLALACDLPRLSADVLHWLRAESARAGAHGLVCVNGGRWEPLCSYYKPLCLVLLETQLAAGHLSLRGLIECGDFAFVEAPDWVSAQLVNVNTPEDWRRVIPGTFF